jgi:hypothetical protein
LLITLIELPSAPRTFLFKTFLRSFHCLPMGGKLLLAFSATAIRLFLCTDRRHLSPSHVQQSLPAGFWLHQRPWQIHQ